MKSHCVFILCHKRPDKVHTYYSLRSQGYTGKIYIVVDNRDPTQEKYLKKFGKEVLIFDKKDLDFDVGDNFDDLRGCIYARNFCLKFAEKEGYRNFWVFDDDFRDFKYRIDETGLFSNGKQIKNLDKIFEIYLKFFEETSSFAISFPMDWSFLGGAASLNNSNRFRRINGSFLLSTERQVLFRGRFPEDELTYLFLGSIGNLLQTVPFVYVDHIKDRDSVKSGGSNDIYCSSFYNTTFLYHLMMNPSCVQISYGDVSGKRIVETFNSGFSKKFLWDKAVPKILRQEHKK